MRSRMGQLNGFGQILKTLKNNPYGNQILLEFRSYTGQTLYAQYAHLSEINVHGNQQVRRGDPIGLTGDTGNAYNVPTKHLHFEIRTTGDMYPGRGLKGREDPGNVFWWLDFDSGG